MAKWFKCPRCIRFGVLWNPKTKQYKCGECLINYSKAEFESNSYHTQFDIDPPGTKKLIKEVMQSLVK